jgi:hypothetical protein
MLTPKFGLVSQALEELHLVSIDLKSQTELEMSVFKNTEAFPNLVELDLSENKGFNFVKIAKNLKNLKRLTTL